MRYFRKWQQNSFVEPAHFRRRRRNRPEPPARMENRENRLLNQVGNRVSLALRVASATVLPVVLFNNAFAAGCHLTLSREQGVHQATVPVRGEAPVKRSFVAAASSKFM